MMELRQVVGAAGVAMRIDMDHADRPLLADRLQDRMGDRMVAADRQRQHAGLDDLVDALFDVVMAEFQPVAALEGDVADIGDAQILNRCATENVIVGSDPLDGAQGARPEARARTIGDAEIHRHADDGDLQIAEIGSSLSTGIYGAVRKVGTPE